MDEQSRAALFHDNDAIAHWAVTQLRPNALMTWHIDKEDLRQEALLQLYKCAQKWDPEQGTKFSTYACKSVVLRLWEIVKKQGQRMASLTGEEEDIDPQDTRDSGHAQRLDAEELSAILGALDQEERDLLEVYFFEGLSMRRIADLLGISQQAVNCKINNSLKHARQAAAAGVYLEDGIAKRASGQARSCPVCGTTWLPTASTPHDRTKCHVHCTSKMKGLVASIDRSGILPKLHKTSLSSPMPFSASYG